MTQVTPHFTKEEFEFSATGIRHGLPNVCPDDLYPNIQLVAAHLELIRDKFGPVRVISGYRSPAVNKAVGGSKTSAHRFAMAADITVATASVEKLAAWCVANLTDYDQVISEFGQWVHVGFTHGHPREEYLVATKDGEETVYTKII